MKASVYRHHQSKWQYCGEVYFADVMDHKYLEHFMEMKVYLMNLSLNGLKCSERDLGTLEMIQCVGSYQLLKELGTFAKVC